jgi:two-component system KDP operon response regulator KdpE
MSARPYVLIVDDEPQFLRALATNVRGAGYEADTAATAEEALTKAGLRTPEAVILDLVLPDRSGIDVTRELRKWTDVPIVIVSAVGEENEKIEALDAGADDYVTKPFAVEAARALARSHARVGPQSAEPVIEIGDLASS